MNKLIAVIALSIAVFGVAPAASARGWNSWHTQGSIEIENEDMFVKTNTNANATSGSVNQWAMGKWGADVGQTSTTGVAVADSFSGVAVGYTKLPCACTGRGSKVEIENEDLFVVTTTNANAVTGSVNQWGVAAGHHGDVWQSGATNNAGSTAESQIMVGYTDFSVSLPD